jgi:lysine-specific demethylase/histidyl-hydroxylase NO66
MEKVFSAHFQTNIYLSPPQAQGFGTHLHGQGFDRGKHRPGPVTREIVLRAGDLFYCPRGFFHSARARKPRFTSPSA